MSLLFSILNANTVFMCSHVFMGIEHNGDGHSIRIWHLILKIYDIYFSGINVYVFLNDQLYSLNIMNTKHMLTSRYVFFIWICFKCRIFSVLGATTLVLQTCIPTTTFNNNWMWWLLVLSCSALYTKALGNDS